MKNNRGIKNGMWKGNDVGYFALHNWIRREKHKPKFCERCNKETPKDLANISGKYKRDVNDFEWLCRRCHMKEDKRMNILKANSEKRTKITEKEAKDLYYNMGLSGMKIASIFNVSPSNVYRKLNLCGQEIKE